MSSETTPAAVSPPPRGRFVDLGKVVADWIEDNLVHGEGDFYGEPFALEPWERWLLHRLYLVDAETLRRVVRRALIVGPQGFGKTALLSAVGLAELAGPTIVDEQGRPAMRASPLIPIAAASWEQTDRLFAQVQIMATHERSKVAPFLEAGETEIRIKGSPGKLYRVAAVGGTNEGGLPTAFIGDELHEWTLPRQRRVHLVLSNKLTKRDQGLELGISTPDDARPDSLLGVMVAYGEQVSSGEIVDPSFLYVRYAAPEHFDLDNPKQLRQAIIAATPASWMKAAVDRTAARYEIDRIPIHEFRRYCLGQFRRPEGSWLPEGTWAPLERGRKLKAAERVVLGFDGSYDHASVGLVACSADGHLEVLAHLERPEGAAEDWRVASSKVDAAVAAAFGRFKVLEMACDSERWSSEIESWAERYGEVVVDFPTKSPKRMVAACSRFYGGVVSGEGLSHDGHAGLSRHLHNAVLKETPDGAYIVKEARDSPRRINLATAAVIAYDRASWHGTAGNQTVPMFISLDDEEG